MKVRLLRYATGAVTAGALVGAGAAHATPDSTAPWHPVSYGLTAEAEELVPVTVSAARPARVVSTAIGPGGKPVVRVREAVDRAAAAQLIKEGQQVPGAISVEIDTLVYALGVPTGPDPYRAYQWDLARMRVAEAWPKSTGSGVTVAVIDTGVDSAHPDLAANVLRGYDAVNNAAGVIGDVNGHGTHVAGTIAAVTGNDVGVSSVAPDAKILPVKVLSDDGSGYASDTAEGIVWAADNGAHVINMSLGGPSRSPAVTNAVAYARSKGVTVVAAAGNERGNGSPVSYPAADEGVIAVAATTPSETVAPYSNAGSYVDVAAPGSDIVSTYPSTFGDPYASLNGTSMASPHIAAVAAMLKAYEPALTPDQIESALEKSAVDLGAKGFDNDFGNGRVDAVAALNAVVRVTPPDGGSPGTPKNTPLITANITAREVFFGAKASVTFTVRTAGKPVARTPVRLCVAEKGGEPVCTDATTSKSGTVAVTRLATAGFRVHVEVAETPTSTAATSAASTFTVRAKAAVKRVTKGVMGVAMLGVDGQTVAVQQSVNRVWVTVGEFPAATVTRVSGLTPGAQYRVVVPDTAGVLGVTSNQITA